MYASVSHPYAVQAVALWLSFVPAFMVITLTIAARFEALRRVAKPVRAFSQRTR